MRADLAHRCILTSSSRLTLGGAPLGIHRSSSRNNSSRVVNKSSVIKTGSLIRLRNSSKCTSSSGVEHSSSIAKTTIMMGKTSSRRTMTQRPQRLSSRPSTNKRNNVQSKVKCHTPTSRSNTPTKEKTSQTREDRSQTPLISLRLISKSWLEQTSQLLMAPHLKQCLKRRLCRPCRLRCLCRQ